MIRELSIGILGLIALICLAVLLKGAQPPKPYCGPGFVLMKGYDAKPVCVLGLQPRTDSQ